MIRLIVFVALAIGLGVCGSTVKLGNKTFFGHVRAIWATDEVKDLKQGVKEKAGPAAEKLKKGVSAGYNAMTEDEKKAAAEEEQKRLAGSGAGSGSGARPAAGTTAGSTKKR
jgi:hypothetical protein